MNVPSAILRTNKNWKFDIDKEFFFHVYTFSSPYTLNIYRGIDLVSRIVTVKAIDLPQLKWIEISAACALSQTDPICIFQTSVTFQKNSQVNFFKNFNSIKQYLIVA